MELSWLVPDDPLAMVAVRFALPVGLPENERREFRRFNGCGSGESPCIGSRNDGVRSGFGWIVIGSNAIQVRGRAARPLAMFTFRFPFP